MREVIIIRNEAPDPAVHVVSALRAAGLPFRFVMPPDGERLPDLDQIMGLVVLGGSQHADDYAGHPYLLDEQRLLVRAIERAVPVLGICLGAQILGLAAGGKLLPSPVRELGFNPVHPTSAGRQDLITSGYDPGDLVFHWHEDIVDLPAGATVLLRGEQVADQAYRFGSCAWGVQFHPEVTLEVIREWFAASGDLKPVWGKSWADVLEDAHRHLASAERRARELIAGFVSALPRPRLRPGHRAGQPRGLADGGDWRRSRSRPAPRP